MSFAAGCVADVPEPWASRFLADGSAELVAAKADKAKDASEPKAASTGKKKGK